MLVSSGFSRKSSFTLCVCSFSTDSLPHSSSDQRELYLLQDSRRKRLREIVHSRRNPLLRLPLLRLPSSTASLNPSHPTLPTSRNMSLLQGLLQTISVPPIRPRKKSHDSRQNLPSRTSQFFFRFLPVFRYHILLLCIALCRYPHNSRSQSQLVPSHRLSNSSDHSVRPLTRVRRERA